MGIITKIVFALGILKCVTAVNVTESIHENMANHIATIVNQTLVVTENVDKNLINSTSTPGNLMKPLSPQKILRKYEDENKARQAKIELRHKAPRRRWGPERNPWRGMKTLEFGRGTYGGTFGSKVPGFLQTPIDKVRDSIPKDLFIGNGYNNKAFRFANRQHGGVPIISHTDDNGGKGYYDSHENNHYRPFVWKAGNAHKSRASKSKTKFDLSRHRDRK